MAMRYVTDDRGDIYDLLDPQDWKMLCHERFLASGKDMYDNPPEWDAFIAASVVYELAVDAREVNMKHT